MEERERQKPIWKGVGSMKKSVKKNIVVLAICMGFSLCCTGCTSEKQTAGKQTFGKDGAVTMRAVLTEDDSITVECTIVNKTKKDIVTGEEYSLQVLKDKSFVDVPLLPEAGGFNLSSKDILSGDEYSFRAYIEKYYGELEAGHYRIVKEYTDKEKDGKKDTEKETVSAEFDLS